MKKEKIIICPKLIIGKTIINYDVEFYATHLSGGIRARNGWHECPHEVYDKKPYRATVVAKESLEKFLQRYEKDFSIEIWE